jgi:hypothetical protein
MLTYIVNVSSGLASAEALERTINQKGKENTIGIFADVKGHSTSPHAGEDEDNYRYLADIERYFGIEVVRIIEGRDIWQAMFDARAITIPSGPSRVAKCSIELKREPLDAWIEANYTPNTCVIVTGLDWSEPHRVASFDAVKHPFVCWHPLNEAPYIDKRYLVEKWRGRGIEAPRLYAAGFNHGNCGGFCVKAGINHFARLYVWNRERYLYHADKEKLFRETINPKATILRLRRGGVARPITLYELAEMIDAGETFNRISDSDDGCGCFAPVQQERMDDVIFQADIH